MLDASYWVNKLGKEADRLLLNSSEIHYNVSKGDVMYYTYMIRCTDNSIYTGMTNNLEKRLEKHVSGDGAKYTKAHKAQKIEVAWRSKEKSLACKLEYQIKHLTKKQKEELINGEKLRNYLKGKIDCRRYYRVDV